MSFRSGQSGTVVQKGQMWHGRYYVDVAGQATRKHMSVPLGSVTAMSKSQAKRKLRTMLEELGLNEDQHLEHVAVGARLFSDEVAWWRENVLVTFKPSCQETMGSHLEKYLLPRFGTLPLAAIDQRKVQEFIAAMTRMSYRWPNGVVRKLSPKTIVNVVGVLKLILGETVWRDWNLKLPEIPPQEQRFFTPEEMRMIVNAVGGQWRVLFATLGGTGMRCGECFGLHVDDLDLVNGRIFIRRNVWNGEEGSPKTKRGFRIVNIEPALVEMLTAHLNGRAGGRVFQTRNGTPFCKSNVRRKLNQVLRKLKLAPAGLNAFRHGRVSVLQANGVPGDLVKEWVGHSNLQTTSRYTHFRESYRQQAARELGLFAPGSLASELPVSPNSPKSAPVTAQAGAA